MAWGAERAHLNTIWPHPSRRRYVLGWFFLDITRSSRRDLFGDVDGNGLLDSFDVDDFEALLAGGGAFVPEPGAGWVVLGVLLAALRRRRSR